MQGILAFCGEGCHGWFTEALSKLPETVDPTKDEFRSLLFSYNPNTSYDSSDHTSRECGCAIGWQILIGAVAHASLSVWLFFFVVPPASCAISSSDMARCFESRIHNNTHTQIP